jgi:hypothetical protein
MRCAQLAPAYKQFEHYSISYVAAFFKEPHPQRLKIALADIFKDDDARIGRFDEFGTKAAVASLHMI